jgi:hypothetical protein
MHAMMLDVTTRVCSTPTAFVPNRQSTESPEKSDPWMEMVVPPMVAPTDGTALLTKGLE